jgi:hypothetical protein
MNTVIDPAKSAAMLMRPLAAGLLAAALAGCNFQGDGSATGTVAEPVAKSRPTGYAKNPGASVRLEYRLPKDWMAGEANRVGLTFHSRSRQAQMKVSVSERNGASLTGDSSFSFDLSTAGPWEAIIEMTPPADGYYQLDVSMIVSDERGQRRVRIESVPITIGDVEGVKPASREASGAGEVVLPAVETYE